MLCLNQILYNQMAIITTSRSTIVITINIKLNSFTLKKIITSSSNNTRTNIINAKVVES